MWYYDYSNGHTAQSWPLSYRQNNANNIAYYFEQQNWTLNAICAMLGNMQIESYLNPGQWEHTAPVGSGGYGLVQWTPHTKYTNWAAANGYNWATQFNPQLERIQYELNNDLQWQPVLWHGMTFRQFSQSEDSVYTLTEAFLRAYENPASFDSLALRQQCAAYWYEYFSGTPPTPPGPEPPVPGGQSKFKLMFYLKPKWKRGLK